jgi:hypothetical protein
MFWNTNLSCWANDATFRKIALHPFSKVTHSDTQNKRFLYSLTGGWEGSRFVMDILWKRKISNIFWNLKQDLSSGLSDNFRVERQEK